MKARVHEHDRWWWAWTFMSGWPRRLRLAWFKRNEFEEKVRHVGCILLGYSIDVRWYR